MPIYSIKGSPVNDHPRKIDPDEDGDLLEQEYGIPNDMGVLMCRGRGKGCTSTKAT